MSSGYMLGSLNGFPGCLEKIDVSSYEEWDWAGDINPSNVGSLSESELNFIIRRSLAEAVNLAWPFDEEVNEDGDDVIIEDRSDGCHGVKCNRTAYRAYNGSTENESNFVGYATIPCPSAQIHADIEYKNCQLHGFLEISGFESIPPKRFLTETNTTKKGKAGECPPSKASQANSAAVEAETELYWAGVTLDEAEEEVENRQQALENASTPEAEAIAQAALDAAQQERDAAQEDYNEKDGIATSKREEADEAQAAHDSQLENVDQATNETASVQEQFDLAKSTRDDAVSEWLEKEETQAIRTNQVSEIDAYSNSIETFNAQISEQNENALLNAESAISQTDLLIEQAESIQNLSTEIQEFADLSAQAKAEGNLIDEAKFAAQTQVATLELIQESINSARLASSAQKSIQSVKNSLEASDSFIYSMKVSTERAVETFQDIATDSGVDSDQNATDSAQSISDSISVTSDNMSILSNSAYGGNTGINEAAENIIASAHSLTATTDAKVRAVSAVDAELEAAGAQALADELTAAANLSSTIANEQSQIVSDYQPLIGDINSQSGNFTNTSTANSESILQRSLDEALQSFQELEPNNVLLEDARRLLEDSCESKNDAISTAAENNYDDGGACCGDTYYDGTTTKQYDRSGAYLGQSDPFTVYYQNGDVWHNSGTASRAPCYTCGELSCTNTYSEWNDPPPCTKLRTTTLSDEYTEEMAIEDAPSSYSSSATAQSRWEVRRSGFIFRKWRSFYEIRCTRLTRGLKYRVTPIIRRRTVSRGVMPGGADGFEGGTYQEVEVDPVEFTATSDVHTINNGGQLIELDHIQGYEYEAWRADIEIIDYNINV